MSQEATTLLLATVLLGAGCLSPAAVPCGPLICPTGSLCNPYTGACVDPTESQRVCMSAAEHAPCAFSGQFPGVQYYCRAGLCTYAYCGDGIADTPLGEVCDDAGPSATCDIDCSRPNCGDGLLNDLAGEVCDCGDGTTETPEGCAGANGEPGSGCGGTCELLCPEGWALVPSGAFPMGCDAGERGGFCGADESPQHLVTLSRDVCVGETEVTVGEYRSCVEQGACAPPVVDKGCTWTAYPGEGEGRPVTCVDWYQARAYCAWLGGDLPTEAEWEKAARGTDGRIFPWGDEGVSCNRAIVSFCAASPLDVGTTSPDGDSPYGLQDMAGNVWEWVYDRYRPSFYADECAEGCTDPLNADPGAGPRGLRGGSEATDASDARASNRNSADPATRLTHAGFRCRWPGDAAVDVP